MMTRWKQIEELYYRTKDLDPQAQSAFPDRASGVDADLRREVESLLQAGHDAQSFLVTTAMNVAAKMIAEETPQTLIGKKISRYKIVERIGAGGMGVLYRAKDARLNRDVAIKVLPAHMSQNNEALMMHAGSTGLQI